MWLFEVPSPLGGMETRISQFVLESCNCSEPTGWDGDNSRHLYTTRINKSSEPTGWDGDHESYFSWVGWKVVPSPLGGMETSFSAKLPRQKLLVPSPLGGMETSLSQHLNIKTIKCSEPTGWDGDISHHLASFKD